MERELLRDYLRCLAHEAGLSLTDADTLADTFMGESEKAQNVAVEAWRKRRSETLNRQLESLRTQTEQVQVLLKYIG